MFTRWAGANAIQRNALPTWGVKSKNKQVGSVWIIPDLLVTLQHDVTLQREWVGWTDTEYLLSWRSNFDVVPSI